MLKRIRTAIIGQGRSGRDIHGAHISRDLERFQIVAVVDPLVERQSRAANEYHCATFDTHSELPGPSDIDLVVNASASRFHVPVTLDLLNRGFNVLCEKPLANRVADVDMLTDTAARNGVLLAVFQQSRYAPYFEKVQEVINSGTLGKIVHIIIRFSGFSRRYDWQTLTSEMGGNLLNTGPHPLDQALQLFGDAEPGVFAVQRNAVSYGDADDFTLLILSHPDSPTIQIELSSVVAYPGNVYEVYGTLGSLKGTMQRLEWKSYDQNSAPKLALDPSPLCREDGTPSYCTDSLQWVEDAWSWQSEQGLFEHMCDRYYSMLYRSLTDGTPLEVTLSHVRRQVSVFEQVSARGVSKL